MKRILGLIGAAIVAGLAASVCCLAPALLVTVGVGGAWIGNLGRFEPFRPYLLTGAWLVLALGFYQNRKSKRGCREGECEIPRAAKIRTISLWIGFVILLISTFGPIGLQILAKGR